MEVFTDMNDNVNEKTTLWTDRVFAFQNSGLSRKEWCQQNQVPLSTFSYWFRKIQSGSSRKEFCNDPVFARLPSEQDILTGNLKDHAPVTICLPKNIRIEINVDCPAGLMAALLHALKNHA